MVKRKIAAVFTAFVMVLSILAGTGIGSIYVNAEGGDGAEAAVDVTLPGTLGLYAAEPGALTVKGNKYYYSEDSEYIDRGYYGAGSLLAPVYMTFKRMNDE